MGHKQPGNYNRTQGFLNTMSLVLGLPDVGNIEGAGHGSEYTDK